MRSARTFVANQLKFDTKDFINNLDIFAKFKFSSLNYSLTNKFARSILSFENVFTSSLYSYSVIAKHYSQSYEISIILKINI